MSESNPSIAFEFDGAVSTFESGWKGPTVITDPPVEGVFNLMRSLIDSGVVVYVVSERISLENGCFAIRSWLVNHGFPMRYVEQLRFARVKPAGMPVIDSFAYGYPGTLPHAALLRPDSETWVPPNEVTTQRSLADTLRLAAEYLEACSTAVEGA